MHELTFVIDLNFQAITKDSGVRIC